MNILAFPFKIRTKFIGAIIVVVALFGSLNIFFNRQSTYRALREEIDQRALHLAQNLADRSTQLLLYEDFISLQQLFDQTIERNKDVSYGFITDVRNQPTVHTFEASFPVELLNAHRLEEGQPFHFQMILDENGRLLRDVLVPILDGKLGHLRLGISEKSLSATTNRVVIILTGMVLAFLVVGIAGAVVFANWITNPITRITKAFETIDLNKEFEPIKIQTRDEIDVLANKFNEMAVRLQKAHSDLKKAQRTHLQTEKLASVGTLASGLTHEISNPLSGLKNCMIRLRRNPEKAQLERYSRLMMNAIQKIERVVIELLNFSRRDDYKFQSFDLHKTINEALSLLEYRLEKSRIEVEKHFDERIKTCYGDSQHIEQVIVNLGLNALDAMPDGGKIDIFSRLNGTSFSIEIVDSGVGIPQENLDKIFDPFFTTKDPDKGTGLGLSVSYNIIKEHGGDISVTSELNKGTKFTINLPLP